MRKQFELHKLNAKGEAAMKAMSLAFDEFATRLEKEFLGPEGKKSREDGLMLNSLEIAFEQAMKAATHRPDFKS